MRDFSGVRDTPVRWGQNLFSFLLCTLCGLAVLVRATGPPGTDPRVLVLTENAAAAARHSRLLDALRSRGYELDVRAVGEEGIALHRDGEFAYGGLILLCPTAAAAKRTLPLVEVERFVDAGRNVLVVAAPGFSAYTQSVAQAVGVDLDESDALVIDHQRPFRAMDDGTATFVLAGGRVKSTFLFGPADLTSGNHGNDIVFRGPGAQLFADNELIDTVIWGSGSSFAYKPATLVTTSPHTSGTATVLGAALSTRVGGRAAYFGSLEALSDDVFTVAGSAHESVMTAFTAWALGHAGVLRAHNLRYSTDRSGSEENGVRVKDNIDFAVDIEAWDGDTSQWVPFVADDVQLEFVMLNPWVRTRLYHAGAGNVTYTAKVPVPDQIGIYKFSIAYHRPGVSSIVLEQVVPVRPFLHNEYPRFIPMAYPYYAASFCMLAAVFLLGLVLMYGNSALVNPVEGKKAPIHAAVQLSRPRPGTARKDE
jgi:oligosaccharyltransferase complex subunit beta